MSIDLASVRAIDTHVHVEADSSGNHALDDELLAAASKYFKATANSTPTIDEIAQYYREQGLAAVVFTVDAHTATGHPALSSEDLVAQAGAAYRRPDPVLLGRPARWRDRGGPAA